MVYRQRAFCVGCLVHFPGHILHTLCTIVCCTVRLYILPGLVFDETQGADATLIPEKQKPKVALSQDPKQAKVHTETLYIVSLHVSTH